MNVPPPLIKASFICCCVRRDPTLLSCSLHQSVPPPRSVQHLQSCHQLSIKRHLPHHPPHIHPCNSQSLLHQPIQLPISPPDILRSLIRPPSNPSNNMFLRSQFRIHSIPHHLQPRQPTTHLIQIPINLLLRLIPLDSLRRRINAISPSLVRLNLFDGLLVSTTRRGSTVVFLTLLGSESGFFGLVFCDCGFTTFGFARTECGEEEGAFEGFEVVGFGV